MISKSILKTINHIYGNIRDKKCFLNELMTNFEQLESGKISIKDFNNWINSWAATAELDSIPGLRNKILFRNKKLEGFLLQSKNAC